MMKSSPLVRAMCMVALPLALLALVCGPSSVSAHGYLSTPPSRQAQCAKGAVSNCGQIIYEPQSVEAPKGRTSCNGDIGMWSSLADESKAWPTTAVTKGVNTFRWTLTAPHATASYEYYINGQRIGFFQGMSTTHSVDLSAFSGRQKMLSIWNIGDTPMAFYACADIVVGSGGSTTPTTAPTSAPTSAPTTRPTTAPTTRPTTAPTVAPTTRPGGSTCKTTTSTYTVRSGDTLGRIASSNRITLAALLAVNAEISNPNLIYISQRIRVPRTVCSGGLESNSTGSVGSEGSDVSSFEPPAESGEPVAETETDIALDLVSTGVGSHWYKEQMALHAASAAPATQQHAALASTAIMLAAALVAALA